MHLWHVFVLPRRLMGTMLLAVAVLIALSVYYTYPLGIYTLRW